MRCEILDPERNVESHITYRTSHIQLEFGLDFQHGVGRKLAEEREASGLGGDNKKNAVGTDASGSVDNDFISHALA